MISILCPPPPASPFTACHLPPSFFGNAIWGLCRYNLIFLYCSQGWNWSPCTTLAFSGQAGCRRSCHMYSMWVVQRRQLAGQRVDFCWLCHFVPCRRRWTASCKFWKPFCARSYLLRNLPISGSVSQKSRREETGDPDFLRSRPDLRPLLAGIHDPGSTGSMMWAVLCWQFFDCQTQTSWLASLALTLGPGSTTRRCYLASFCGFEFQFSS